MDEKEKEINEVVDENEAPLTAEMENELSNGKGEDED